MANGITYYSTNRQIKGFSFQEALLKGLAPDRGLFMPERIPVLSSREIEHFSHLTYPEIAWHILHRYLNHEIDDDELKSLANEAYNFNVPLEKAGARKYILRLDQGPTASFKDFAARMMGRLMQYFLQKQNREMLILTATSGDTGSAIANAFYGLSNIKVVILFPEKEVSDRQRKQMTTLDQNIQVVALDGKFDDCQSMVKSAFNDRELDHLKLSSANSINIGRLLPQSVYYFYACSRLAEPGEEIVFSVPSGNFGNLMGGLIARQMGLPVKKFVIGTNENDEVPEYFKSDRYQTIAPSRNCISSAMNVGHPSNMARVIELYGGHMNEKGEIIRQPDLERLKTDMFAVSISDQQTKAMIKHAWKNDGLLLEPHGAVGWYALYKYIEKIQENAGSDPNTTGNHEQLYISLETAHPAKFPDQIRELIHIEPEMPESMKELDKLDEKMVRISNGYEAFKSYLLANY